MSLYFKSFFSHRSLHSFLGFTNGRKRIALPTAILYQHSSVPGTRSYIFFDFSNPAFSLSLCHHKGSSSSSSPLLASYLISDRQETHGGNDVAGAFDLISHESRMRIILNVSISKGSLCIAGDGCSCWNMIKAYYGNKPETTARFCCSCCW